jgi:hypothetical protein
MDKNDEEIRKLNEEARKKRKPNYFFSKENHKQVNLVKDYLKVNEKLIMCKINRCTYNLFNAKTIFFIFKKMKEGFSASDFSDDSLKKFKVLVIDLIQFFAKTKEQKALVEDIILFMLLSKVMKNHRLVINADIVRYLRVFNIKTNLSSVLDDLDGLQIEDSSIPLKEWAPLTLYRAMNELSFASPMIEKSIIPHLLEILDNNCLIKVLRIDFEQSKLSLASLSKFLKSIKKLEFFDIRNLNITSNYKDVIMDNFLNNNVNQLVLAKCACELEVIKEIYNRYPKTKKLRIEIKENFPYYDIGNGVRHIAFPNEETWLKFKDFKEYYTGFDFEVLCFINMPKEKKEPTPNPNPNAKKSPFPPQQKKNKYIDIDKLGESTVEDMTKLKKDISRDLKLIRVKEEGILENASNNTIKIIGQITDAMPIEILKIESRYPQTDEFISSLVNIIKLFKITVCELKMGREKVAEPAKFESLFTKFMKQNK